MSTEVARRSPVQELVSQVRGDVFLEQLRMALPGNVRPERFQRAVVTAIMQDPEIVVDQGTFLQSAIRAAQDGLIPDGREAAFVVVKEKGAKKVAYWPMIGGYRKIAAKHGITLVAEVVCQNDRFEWSKMPPRLDHVPALEDRGEIVCAYAAAFDREWRFVAAPVVMNVEAIEKVRAVSRAGQSEYGPWKNWWDRMACKTVARRLFNELPLGDLEEIDARIVAAADDEADLPRGSRLNVDEADIVAGLTNVQPPDDDGPDDQAGEIVEEEDEPDVGDAPELASAKQHADLLELGVALETAKPGKDWTAEVAAYCKREFDSDAEHLTVEQMDELIGVFNAKLPKAARKAA